VLIANRMLQGNFRRDQGFFSAVRQLFSGDQHHCAQVFGVAEAAFSGVLAIW
jgi:hypothetical protein